MKIVDNLRGSDEKVDRLEKPVNADPAQIGEF